MYGIGLAGGVRAIFEVANRLHERGYNIRIIALGGDHSWFRVKVPIHYVDQPRIFSLGIKTYKLLRYAKIRNINADYFGIATLMRKRASC
ncbi:hypothetical protein DDW08_00265 [Vulcanisaeta sp. SCGC AB-777_J10]|nr:hypothetical protein DDW08_00265 [Vulcanisaeta sp. SCGC AB-777_J10]